MWNNPPLTFAKEFSGNNDGEPSREELLVIEHMAISTVDVIVEYLAETEYYENLEYELRYN